MFADVRAAWNRTGLSLSVRVAGKKQTPWCRAARAEDSDGLHLWIDTRDTHNIHRASRYCHRFVFLPAGDGPQFQRPVAVWLPINRAKDNPKQVLAGSPAGPQPVAGGRLHARSPRAGQGLDRVRPGRISAPRILLRRDRSRTGLADASRWGPSSRLRKIPACGARSNSKTVRPHTVEPKSFSP